MKKRIVKGDQCLNCGQALDGENFCPNCGQLNNIAKPTFGQLISDALANLFAWDSKFYLSIWPLMTKPGKLSLDIVNGKKSSYLPPIRLFVLMVVISLVLNSISNRVSRSWDDISHLRTSEKTMSETIEKNDDDSTQVDNSDINTSITFKEGESGTKLKTMYEFAKNNPDVKVADALVKMGIQDNFWNHFEYTNVLKFTLMKPSEYRSFLESNLLIILLLFIPVLALLLKILYFYKSDYFYVDHFVFSLHLQTALFVFISLNTITEFFVDDIGLVLIFLGFPVYLFLSLRNFYKQRWYFTLANFMVINITFMIVSSIFLFLVMLVSFVLI